MRMRTRYLKTALSLLLALGLINAQAQLRFTFSSSGNPPAQLVKWQDQKQLGVLSVFPNPQIKQFRIAIKLTLDGEVAVQTDPKRARLLSLGASAGTPAPSIFFAEDIFTYNALVIKGKNESSIQKTGKLIAGNYQLCIRLTDAEGIRFISEEICRPVVITAYQPPSLLMPANGSEVNCNNRRILFRWTPVVPRPPHRVNYRLRVFEVLPGQQPVQAYRVNRPILEREIPEATQLLWPPDFDLPMPGRTYIWNVEALDEEGKAVGENAGLGEPFTFRISQGAGCPPTPEGDWHGNILINWLNQRDCVYPCDTITLSFSGAAWTPGHQYTLKLMQQQSNGNYYQIAILNNNIAYTSGGVSVALPCNLQPGTYQLFIDCNNCNGYTGGGYSEGPQIKVCKKVGEVIPIGCACGKWEAVTMNWSNVIDNNNNNQGAKAATGNVQSKKLDCGKSYEVQCNRPYTFKFNYLCKPGNCNASYNVTLKDANGNTQTFTNVNGNNFPYTFTGGGVYTMTVYPKCGDRVCDTCVIRFNTNCPDCCKELIKEIKDKKPVISGSNLQLNTQFALNMPVQQITATVVSMQSALICPKPGGSSVSNSSMPAVISSGLCTGLPTVGIPYQSEAQFSGGSTASPSVTLNLALPPSSTQDKCREIITVCVRYLLTRIVEGKCLSCEVVRCYTIER
jgi:hypothetical protein